MKRKSAVLALAVVVLSATAVQAVPTTYVYTGNPFTNVSGPYSTSDFVTAMVTLGSPLAANTTFTQVTPLAFSLSDGVQTITNFNATTSLFFFATGPTAMITQWRVTGFAAAPFPRSIETVNDNTGAFDFGETLLPRGAFGSNNSSPGVWATAPDVGSSLALLSLSLTALGVAARQFKRGAA